MHFTLISSQLTCPPNAPLDPQGNHNSLLIYILVSINWTSTAFLIFNAKSISSSTFSTTPSSWLFLKLILLSNVDMLKKKKVKNEREERLDTPHFCFPWALYIIYMTNRKFGSSGKVSYIYGMYFSIVLQHGQIHTLGSWSHLIDQKRLTCNICHTNLSWLWGVSKSSYAMLLTQNAATYLMLNYPFSL